MSHQFQRIHVSQLHIDPMVQRALIPARVNAMSAAFDVDATGALVVNRRSYGWVFFVIDGGHRVAAANKSGYDGELDCIVHDGLSLQKEAELFLALNDSRKVNAVELFRIRTVAEEPDAVFMNGVLKGLDWYVANGSGNRKFCSVVALQNVYNGAGVLTKGAYPELVSDTMIVITQAWGHDKQGVRAGIVNGTGQLLAHYGDKIDLDKLARAMSKVGPVPLYSKGCGLKDAMGNGQIPRAVAMVLLTEYNKSLRTVNRLPEWGAV